MYTEEILKPMYNKIYVILDYVRNYGRNYWSVAVTFVAMFLAMTHDYVVKKVTTHIVISVINLYDPHGEKKVSLK